MNRSMPITILFACTFILPIHAQDFEKIRVETIPLGGSVYMLASRAGGNLAVCAGDDGVFLVDSDYKELFDKVQAAVAKISDKPIRFVVNTHWHFDHVGGNEGFAKKGSILVAHENVRKRLASDQHIGILGIDVPASPKEALPIITYTNGVTFYLNGEEIAVIHVPKAHTDGDGIVHFKKANVIHTGDIVFNRAYPFIDVTNGGSIDGMIAAVETILKRCDDETRIIPGHGPLSNKAELETYWDMLREFRDAVAREIASGKDLKAVQTSKAVTDLGGKWHRTHFPLPQFTEMIYQSLRKQ
jgi:glyoxylase-like metal-dependent hydrolase (beta-lactamase superfamily II)